ncbi:MAG: Gfo/Idh/MocA family oxidoreductase, partial [Gemmatimonadetes bacterium]|nr:Gfo/Idh/MocA family oxidoreductase [Gemmatimonadota bacterium]
MLRVCVIGLGPIGNRHADIYVENPLSELVGVCDIDETRANATAQLLGVTAFYNVQKMLEDRKPDVVSVARSE